MPLPGGISTVTVTGKFLGPDGAPLSGVVKFYLPATVSFPGSDLFVDGVSNNTLNASGSFTATLVATDNANINPSGWGYEVVEHTNARTRNYWIALPSSPATVDLADLAPMDPARGNYIVIQGADGDPGPPGADGAPGADGVSGSIIRTASVRIIDDNLGGLPSAASWTVAKTSSNTALQASITASVGDRIRVCGHFMRAGSHFLDWGRLTSTGTTSEFAGSGTSSPLSEGNPSMYPSLSFSYVGGEEMFVVASGDVDLSGKVTIALMHQGTGSGTVYAHPVYPWRLRLENIGPEPS